MSNLITSINTSPLLTPQAAPQRATAQKSGFNKLPFVIAETIFSNMSFTETARTGHVLSKTYHNLLPNSGILDLSRSNITDQDLLNILKKCKGREIVSINLRDCYGITDKGLSYLAPLKQLKTLDLHGCWRITEEGLKHLRGLQQLEKLDLFFCHKVTDEALEHIGVLRNLKTLVFFKCPHITDEGLKHLTSLKQLKNLSLSHCYSITHNGIKYLPALEQLTRLDLSSCYLIKEIGLEHLSAIRHLKTVNFSGCTRITDAARARFEERLHQKDQQSVLESLNSSNILAKNTLFPESEVRGLHKLIADYI